MIPVKYHPRQGLILDSQHFNWLTKYRLPNVSTKLVLQYFRASTSQFLLHICSGVGVKWVSHSSMFLTIICSYIISTDPKTIEMNFPSTASMRICVCIHVCGVCTQTHTHIYTYKRPHTKCITHARGRINDKLLSTRTISGIYYDFGHRSSYQSAFHPAINSISNSQLQSKSITHNTNCRCIRYFTFVTKSQRYNVRDKFQSANGFLQV